MMNSNNDELSQEIILLAQDFEKQELFVKTMLVMLHELGNEKDATVVPRVTLGFKIGEIYRMLTEFLQSCTELKIDTLSLLEQMKRITEVTIDKKEKEKSESHILLD